MRSRASAIRVAIRLGVCAALLGPAVACSGSSGNSRRHGGIPTATRDGRPKRGPGFDGTKITVGAAAPLTGPTAPLAKNILAGNQLYWDELNARGGVAGRYRVRVKQVDRQFFESVAVIRYDEIENHIALLSQVFDTKAAKALLPRLQMHHVVAVPATDASEWTGEQNLIPLGAPAEIRAVNAIAYWAGHGGRGQTLCALHQDDTYGPVGFEGVTFAARELHLRLAAQPTFKPLEAVLDRQVDELRAAGCDAVFFNGLGYQALSAVRHAKALGFAPRWIVSAQSWDQTVAVADDVAGYLHAHLWVVGNGPTWGDRSVAGMRRLVAARRRFAPRSEPDVAFVTGYVQAWAAGQVLDAAVRHGDLSRGGLLDATKRVGSLRFEGLYPDAALGTSAVARQPVRASTVFEADRSVPGGLRAVQSDTASEPAKRFVLPRA